MTPQLLWLTLMTMTTTLIMTHDLLLPQLFWYTIYDSNNYYDARSMTPKIWFHLIMDITIVLYCILITIFIVNIELEH